MPQSRIAAHLALAFVLVGCASSPESRCSAGEQRLVSDLLYFGTAKPGRFVTTEEWSEFLRSVVTPKFPEGVTAWQAAGQWQSANGVITNEASHVLNLVHPETQEAEAAVRAVVSEYKVRFQQEAVLRAKGYACVSF
jgi:hypothetical protein